jgi:hypothetical protein
MPEKSSLDFVLAEMKARADAQEKQIATLDTKATFVLTSASVLIAGAAAVQKVTPTASQPAALDAAVFYGGAAIALVLYVIVVDATIKAYMPRTYRRAPEPPALEERLARSDGETKEAVFKGLVEAFAKNEEIVEGKAQQTRAALTWLRREALWLAIWLGVVMVTQII